MSSAKRVFLARHGQTSYNLEGRFQGQQAVPLDDTGREQAGELAERAAGYEFAALWCSPLLRARETAEIVSARIGLSLREDARLMETDAGALPALVVCHGMVIRAALSARGGEWLPNGQRVQNGAIVPLDPIAAAEGRADLGDEGATVAS